MTSPYSSKQLAILALLATMIFWGSAAVFMRTLALSLSPENSLALRYVFITAINVAVLLALGTWRIPRADWGRFLVAGLAGMGGYNWFVNEGFALVPAGLGTIITMVEPFMIAVLAWALLSERLSRFVWLGIVIASIGAIVLFWDDLTSATGSTVSVRGIIYLLFCCLCWAIYTIAAKPLLQTYDSLTVTALTMTIAAPFMIALASEPLLQLAQRLDLRQWAELVYLIGPSGLIGTLLWNYGSKNLTGAATGMFLYLIPVVAVACGALILAEPVTVNIVLGGLLMLAGVAVVQFGPSLTRRS
jgi:drug/metabolite transporter (DMT)-like permease